MGDVLDQLGIEAGALVVNIVGFLLLIYLMRRFAFGPIGDFMRQRAGRIESDLRRARQQRDEAEARHRNLQAELDDLREQFRADMARSTREAKQAIAELHAESREQRQQMILDAETQLRQSREAMLAELKGQVADLAVEVATKLLRDTLSQERQDALVEAFIADIDRLEPHGRRDNDVN